MDMKATSASTTDGLPVRRRRHLRHASFALGGLALGYVLVSYVVAPLVWSQYLSRHPWLDDAPGITQTRAGIPGDPLNVALVGIEQQLREAMTAAGWHAADPLGVRSDARIAVDTVLKRPYETAPVSRLYLFGRPEDLAFERPVGDDPRRRHHVRFWRSPTDEPGGLPAWLGSATYDERVGFSHTTGQVTHHIAPDVDAERDRLFAQLKAAGRLASVETIDDFHPIREGRNGGGDPWRTDGRLLVGRLAAEP
jgi:hypothetical protein